MIKYLSASDVSRRSGVPNSKTHRLIHSGGLRPDAVVNDMVLFAEARLAELQAVLTKRSAID